MARATTFCIPYM